MKGSPVVFMSHPDAVAAIIEQAANAQH